MSVRKIRNKWWVDIRFKEERYRKKSPDNTRSGALAYEATLRARLAAGERVDGDRCASVPTLAAFAPTWMERSVAANNKPSDQATKESILRVHLLPALGRKPLDAIFSEDVEKYKAVKLRSGLTRQSVNNHLNVLRKCLRTAMEWRILQTLPMFRRLPAQSYRLDHLDDEESRRLLAQPATLWSNMVAVALHTGLRFGELAGLHWEDVDVETGVITVRRSLVKGIMGTTKSHRVRHVPMTTATIERLPPEARAAGFVFHDREGNPVTYAAAVHGLRVLCRQAGVRRVRWHVLRHTFASRLAMRAVPILNIQKLLGHSTVAMTERYAHLAPSCLREAVALLDDPSPSQGFWATGGQRLPSTPLVAVS